VITENKSCCFSFS